jgi:hypothetical protein
MNSDFPPRKFDESQRSSPPRTKKTALAPNASHDGGGGSDDSQRVILSNRALDFPAFFKESSVGTSMRRDLVLRAVLVRISSEKDRSSMPPHFGILMAGKHVLSRARESNCLSGAQRTVK